MRRRVELGTRCIGTAWLSAMVAILCVAPAGADERSAPDLTTDAQTATVASSAGASPPSAETNEVKADAKEEAKPARPAKPRKGGINPCNTPDPGYGIYAHWSRNVSMGQVLAPQRGGLTKSGGFDLIVHFHGHEAVRKEFVKVAKGVVLVGIDLGIGSGVYGQSFAAPHVFENLLESVEREMARRNGRQNAYVRKLALSSWSAGYGAIDQILRQPIAKKVDAVILLDSLHAGYADQSAKDLRKRLKTIQIEPFIEFARKAAGGQKVMFQSHSSIPPPGYASTREVSQFIIREIGGKLHKARRDDVLGLEMLERYDRAGYHVRGYGGDDKPDHCAHLGLIRDVLRVHLKPRWNTPLGRAGKPPAETSVAKAKVERSRKGNVHVVASGESLGRIARRHDITVKALREANGLTPGGRKIQPGDELVIPAAGAAPIAMSKAVEAPKDKDKPKDKSTDKDKATNKDKAKGKDKPKSRQPGERVHLVESGEALIPIAKRYGVTVKALRERNGLRKNGRSIQPGEQLIIPALN